MGAMPATHDQVTRCPGSFDQMRAGVERLHRLAQSGTGFCFNVLVHRANQHELKAMLDLAVELNAQAAYLMVIHPSPDDDPGARALCFPVDEFREAVRAWGRSGTTIGATCTSNLVRLGAPIFTPAASIAFSPSVVRPARPVRRVWRYTPRRAWSIPA